MASATSQPEPNAQILLRDVGVSFSRNKTTKAAFTGVNLDIEAGHFLVIVGPSGCGKTTLLRVLGGLVAPTEGAMVAESNPRINMVFQADSLFPWMTVLDNVAIGRRFRKFSKKERREAAMNEVERVGLSDWAHAYPWQLSGGMRQRVNLARAWANEPDVMLMDEPFAALDVQSRAVMQSELLGLWERDRRTVVFVTHSIEEAIILGDRIIVMGGSPGIVKDEIDVGFSRPRDAVHMRSDARFLDLNERIWNLIEDEVRAAQDRGKKG